MQRNELQILLDQVEFLAYKYGKSNQDRFNIFNILSKKFDEVNLHSKFLNVILDPRGEHNLGDIFLKKFLDVMQITDFSLQSVKVKKEYRKIDLLITNGKQAIVIENKLWATDQPEQLQRYYETLFQEGYRDIRLFYLSIDGKEPSESSIGTLKHRTDLNKILTCISYKVEVEHWIECCIKESYSKPTIRETLAQYRSLLREITGQTMHKE